MFSNQSLKVWIYIYTQDSHDIKMLQ